MHALFAHADIGLAMLLFFFSMFVGIAVWALRPANKEMIESHKYIPLKENADD
jgi:cbb3-type cytochrome oxidase subunit 3